jgi:tungstate transport system substrate-binding protein
VKRIRLGMLLVALLLSVGLLACGGGNDNSTSTATPEAGMTATPQAEATAGEAAATDTPVARSGPKDVILATTTSTQGQALAMGERGDADVMLVHAPASEKNVVDEGVGINRRLVMHNDFVLLGPESDPAGVKDTTLATDALTKIYDAGAAFLSRGDDSGTDKLEKALWKKAGLDPTGESWYDESGQGMGASLQIANQRDAYIMSDRGTYLATKDSLSLTIVLEGDPQLLNVYSVMEVNPEKFDLVNGPGGQAFADFMVSDEAQAIIKDFGVDKYGQPLFVPDADKTYEELGLATPFG